MCYMKYGCDAGYNKMFENLVASAKPSYTLPNWNFRLVSGGAAQQIRAQVSNRKVVNSRFRFQTGQYILLSLVKTPHVYNPRTGPKHLPTVAS